MPSCSEICVLSFTAAPRSQSLMPGRHRRNGCRLPGAPARAAMARPGPGRARRDAEACTASYVRAAPLPQRGRPAPAAPGAPPAGSRLPPRRRTGRGARRDAGMLGCWELAGGAGRGRGWRGRSQTELRQGSTRSFARKCLISCPVWGPGPRRGARPPSAQLCAARAAPGGRGLCNVGHVGPGRQPPALPRAAEAPRLTSSPASTSSKPGCLEQREREKYYTYPALEQM